MKRAHLVPEILLVLLALLVPTRGDPASKGSKGADAVWTAPKAMDVVPPEMPGWMRDSAAVGFVELAVILRDTGQVSAAAVLESSDSRLDKTAVDSARRWTFTPALKDGMPSGTAGVVRIDFSSAGVSVEPPRSMPRPDAMPKTLSIPQPVYPRELLGSGNRGRVVVAFVLNSKGEVLIPRVVESTHPAFEQSALDAVLKARFKPAQVKGKPVPISTALPIVFSIDSTNTGGVDTFSVNMKRNKKQPKAEQLDSAPRPKLVVLPVHPFEAAAGRKSGSAKVVFVVGADGRVAMAAVEKASAPEFGMALVAAIEASEFEPAIRQGEPVAANLVREQEFGTSGRDATLEFEAASIAREIAKGTFAAAKPSELDAPLRPRVSAAPAFPTAPQLRGSDGHAVVEIVVDRKGRVIVPRVIEASAPEFGWAAMTAAQRWFFDPPTVRGKPVEVVARIPFHFTPGGSAAREATN